MHLQSLFCSIIFVSEAFPLFPLKWALLFPVLTLLNWDTQKQLLEQHLAHNGSCCFYSGSMNCPGSLHVQGKQVHFHKEVYRIPAVDSDSCSYLAQLVLF